jgi:hypothetical protein
MTGGDDVVSGGDGDDRLMGDGDVGTPMDLRHATLEGGDDVVTGGAGGT